MSDPPPGPGGDLADDRPHVVLVVVTDPDDDAASLGLDDLADLEVVAVAVGDSPHVDPDVPRAAPLVTCSCKARRTCASTGEAALRARLHHSIHHTRLDAPQPRQFRPAARSQTRSTP